MYMNDGHSGIENRQVNQGGSGNFQFILAYLKQGTGHGEFVIHATSNTFYSFGLQPLEFLAEIGFTHYSGECPFHRDRCFYRVIARLARDVHGVEHFDQVQSIYNAFKIFAGRIGELFQLRQQEDRILREIEIGIRSERRAIFGQPVEIAISEKDVPLWVNEVKFQRLRELETQRDAVQREISNLSGYLPLLYGTGEPLEEAVVRALQFLGLNAERAPKGFTADILAQTPDGVQKFGFEVTGTAGPIKKDSKKLTQLLEFERIKEHGEKTVLVANTYSTMPINQRMEQEHFTPQVLEFLSRHAILLVTGWDLYCMVGDVLEESRSKEEIIEILYTTNGQLKYARSA
jgi:hypothetical protein